MTGVQNFALVVYAFLLTLLMQALPLWLVITAVIVLIWKWWILRTGTAQPSRLLLTALGSLMLALVFLDSAPVFSRESLMAIVCITGLIFLLDREHIRQVMLVHGALYSMLVSLLVMRGEPLPLFLYFFLTVLIFFSLLIHHLPPTALLTLWPLGRNILKIAAPVSAILLPVYFFFPDFRTKNNDYATSGLADSLEPGRIAQLALSDRVAFRVRFLSPVAGGQSLYWRSTVLEDSFGMTWRKKKLPEMQIFTPRPVSGPIRYEMIPEIRLGLALPLLEHSMTVEGLGREASTVWWLPDFRMFQSGNEIIVASAAVHDRFIPKDEPRAITLEIQTSERVREIVTALKARTPAEQIRYLQHLFSGYTYTLKPGSLNSDDPLDDFIFNKQRGFCEHFAAAFATLLQLAGTPARVITGYEGGIFIGSSDFMLVRDSDAHAWTEVFLDHRWQRIDPSAFVRTNVTRTPAPVWVTALPSAWFAYGLRVVVIKLREWAQEFEYLWMGLVAVLAIIVPLQLWRMQRKKQQRAPWQTAMDRFLLDLQKKGLRREPFETMGDFLRRVSTHYPQNQPDLEQLRQIFQATRYGPPNDPALARRLTEAFQGLRVKP